MTREEHLRVMISELVLRVAQLAAENDDLKAQLVQNEKVITAMAVEKR